MITFPCCKINLGLNVVSRRPDGYHDIETVFYPIPLTDALDVKLIQERDLRHKRSGKRIFGYPPD